MTERERLIELLESTGMVENKARCMIIADELIASGVIAPPCKVGDDVWWVDEDEGEVHRAKENIEAVCYYGDDHFKVITKGSEGFPEDLHTRWCMLTEKEAKNYLRRVCDEQAD